MSRRYELVLENGGLMRVDTEEDDIVEVVWSSFDEYIDKIMRVTHGSGMFQEAFESSTIEDANRTIKELKSFFEMIRNSEPEDNYKEILSIIRKREPELFELIREF